MRNSEQIIDLVKDICKEEDITLTELSKRTGIPKATMSRYFNKNREFPITKIDLFAKALSLTTEYLLGIPTEANGEREITLSKKPNKLILEINLKPTEEELFKIIKQLNSKGKEEAIKKLKEMLYIPDYTE